MIRPALVTVLLLTLGLFMASGPALAQAPPDLSSSDTLRTSGKASYYAAYLEGRPTASGQPYDPERLTASHRTLPFGTYVKVTRRFTGDTVTVMINDRGPQKQERILDLSRRAAEALNMIDAGVVDIEIEVVEGPEE
ncbi:MAG: septal ring lytic transglycosylase RlpA family protein [Longimonas sp.]|uniref:septal ring lytic transglycosylase RlpA family protein n=1 Tax=Longimonas sp. TaxID=2039626 RepID=UPI003362E291